MFKKRTRPTSVREKPTESTEPTTEAPEDNIEGADDDDAAVDVQDLLLLRKLRRSAAQQQGIDLERLNRGDDGKKGRRARLVEEEEGASEKYGLQTQQSKGDGDDDLEDEREKAKRLVRSNNFTQQTNALDVDKHMLAYIETEMTKRRGDLQTSSSSSEPYDPQAELYKIAERYKVEQRMIQAREEEEGNVTNSVGMLTSIPEVDLGMDTRLKNIEETERAKREMMESRKQSYANRKKPEDEDYASARFFRPHQRVASDIYAIEDAKRDATGLEPPKPKPPRTDRMPHENATDEQVYERFKKRMKR